MIDVLWGVSLRATGGRFSVPDGTPDREIARLVVDEVERSVDFGWSPHVAAPKGDILKDGD